LQFSDRPVLRTDKYTCAHSRLADFLRPGSA
jgi:hypothetical protein